MNIDKNTKTILRQKEVQAQKLPGAETALTLELVANFIRRNSVKKKLASLLAFITGKKLKLTMGLDTGSYTDGQRVNIGIEQRNFNVPTLGEFYILLVAVLGHEAQHVLSSNFNAFQRYITKMSKRLADEGIDNEKFATYVVHSVGNIIEDGRIERILGRNMPGMVKKLQFMNLHEWRTYTMSGKEDNISAIMNTMLMHSKLGVYPKGYAEQFGDTEIDEIFESVKGFIPQGIVARTHGESLRVCEKIIETLLPFFVVEYEKVKEQEEMMKQLMELLKDMAESSTYSESEESETNDSAGEGSPIHINMPGGKPGKGKSGGSQGEDSEESEDSEGGKGSGSGKSGKKSKKKPGKSSEKNSEGDDEGKSGGKPGEEEGEAEDGSGANGKKGKDSDEDGEKSDEGDADSDGKEKSDDEGKDKGQDGESDADSGKEPGGDNTDDGSNNESSGREETMPDKEVERTDEEIEALIEEIKNQVDEESSEVLDELAQSEGKSVRDKLNEEFDRTVEFTRAEVGASFSEEPLQKEPTYDVPVEIKVPAKKFKKDVEKIFKARSQFNLNGQKKGVLSNEDLFRVGMKDFNVFTMEGSKSLSDHVFYILQDGSGSMCGEKERQSAYALSIIEEGLKGLVPFKISTFSAGGSTIIHYVVKPWTGKSKKNYAFSSFKNRSAGGGNEDDVSIRVATKELLARPERDKVLIVLSDGLPSSEERVKMAVKEARKQKIHVVGIMFGDNNFRGSYYERYKHMYEKNIISCAVNSIPNKLSETLKKILSR